MAQHVAILPACHLLLPVPSSDKLQAAEISPCGSAFFIVSLLNQMVIYPCGQYIKHTLWRWYALFVMKGDLADMIYVHLPCMMYEYMVRSQSDNYIVNSN